MIVSFKLGTYSADSQTKSIGLIWGSAAVVSSQVFIVHSAAYVHVTMHAIDGRNLQAWGKSIDARPYCCGHEKA